MDINKLNTIIVDDESHCRSLLKQMLAERSEINIMASCADVDQAIAMLKQETPDLILLDIQMPEKDGFYLIEYLKENDLYPTIIFTTAFDQYAIKAIKASAFDYLLKPVKKDELFKSIDRLIDDQKTLPNSREQIVQIVNELTSNKQLKFSDKNGYFFIPVNDLLYLESDGNYTNLHTTENTKHTLSNNIGKVEQSLPVNQFVRISRFTIINTKHLNRVNRKKGFCLLQFNGSPIELQLSRRYAKKVEEKLVSIMCHKS